MTTEDFKLQHTGHSNEACYVLEPDGHYIGTIVRDEDSVGAWTAYLGTNGNEKPIGKYRSLDRSKEALVTIYKAMVVFEAALARGKSKRIID
jgi:hypothetical protein